MANPVLSDRANQDRVTILTLRAEREALLRRSEGLESAVRDAVRLLRATSQLHAYTWSQEVARNLEDSLSEVSRG